MTDQTYKSILILSPQAWGGMYISKHHYAIELAKRGHKVYYLNPPLQGGEAQGYRRSVAIECSDVHPNLFLVNHQLNFPYNLRFRFLSFFHWLMKFHIRALLNNLGPIDIIWSFDLNNLYPMTLFKRATLRIFHPVDEPLTSQAIKAAQGADVIFSVTHEILKRYNAYSVPKYFINHGVTGDFLLAPPAPFVRPAVIRVGLSGNMLRPEIDRPTLLKIIKDNRNCLFEFWGSFKINHTNIGGRNSDEFIAELQSQKNVILHGVVPPSKLAKEFRRVDLFLICYDVQKDQSKGTNYHKVMEYLSTGKITVSNNITTYAKEPDLIQMVSERTNNDALPALFATVVQNIEAYNSYSLMMKRHSFAKSNSYDVQIQKIFQLLDGINK